MAAGFDTLRAAKRLRDAGASEELAEALTETLRESRELDLSQLATKTDLLLLEQRMTIKLGGIVVAVGAALGAFLKLFPGGHP